MDDGPQRAADAEPALFPEPEHDNSLYAAFPPALVKDTALHNGLRYTHIGEDGDTLVFLGHPDPARVLAVGYEQCGIDDDVPAVELLHTWARLLTHCPDHLAEHAKDCQWCEGISLADSWWLDWGVPEGAKPDTNSGTDGYFPVTCWDLDP